MDDFFRKTVCDRCGASLSEGRIMSMYNEDCICMACKEKERQRDDYDKARDADAAHTKKMYSAGLPSFFPGIGLNN